MPKQWCCSPASPGWIVWNFWSQNENHSEATPYTRLVNRGVESAYVNAWRLGQKTNASEKQRDPFCACETELVHKADYLLWIPVNLLYWERCWKANIQRENVATFRRVSYVYIYQHLPTIIYGLYRARSGNIWGTTDYPHWQFMYVVVGYCVRWHSKRSQLCGWNSGGFYDMWIKLGYIKPHRSTGDSLFIIEGVHPAQRYDMESWQNWYIGPSGSFWLDWYSHP